MPLLGLIASAIGWIIARFNPFWLAVIAALISFAFGVLEDALYWLARVSLFLFSFLVEASPKLSGVSVSSLLDDVPEAAVSLIGRLRVFDAASLLVCGLAIRVVRKSILRW